jgi:putative salt-induced outer membrane protein YdiY
VLALLPSFLTAATVLRLRNGDRVSGELLRRADGKIFFRSPVLGEIVVNEADAVVVEEPDTPVESLVGLPPDNSAVPMSASTPPPAPSDPSATEPQVTPKHPWHGTIEFGYQQQSGRNNATSYSIRGDSDRTVGTLDTKISGRMLYGKQDESVSTDRYDASLRFRYELSKRAFAQSLSSYTSDRVKGIDLNFEQNVGAGFRLFKSTRHEANIGLGATEQVREADGITNDKKLLGEFFQDYTYHFSGRLSFLQDANLQYSPKYVSNGQRDMPNYRIRFNTALQGKISERVSLNLRYEYEFDNTVPYTAEKQDQRITSSIGYSL